MLSTPSAQMYGVLAQPNAISRTLLVSTRRFATSQSASKPATKASRVSAPQREEQSRSSKEAISPNRQAKTDEQAPIVRGVLSPEQSNVLLSKHQSVFAKNVAVTGNVNKTLVSFPWDWSVPVAEVPQMSPAQVHLEFTEAARAQHEWALLPLAERVRRVERLVALVAADEELARDITLGMGKPYEQSLAEQRGFAARARDLLAIAPMALATAEAEGCSRALGVDEWAASPLQRPVPGAPALSGSGASYTRAVARAPAGTVLAITPWNYPLLTLASWLVPGLVAGNAVVMSPSVQVHAAFVRLLAHAHAAGIPALRLLHAPHTALWQGVAAAATRGQGPAVISFTGSNAAGQRVAVAAGRAAPLAALYLELGGSDAVYLGESAAHADRDTFIRARDGNNDSSGSTITSGGAGSSTAAPPSLLARAVGDLVESAWWNAGQSCCGPQRVLVHESVAAEVRERMEEEFARVRVGDPRTWLFGKQGNAGGVSPGKVGATNAGTASAEGAQLGDVRARAGVVSAGVQRDYLHFLGGSSSGNLDSSAGITSPTSSSAPARPHEEYEAHTRAAVAAGGGYMASLALPGAGAQVRAVAQAHVRSLGRGSVVGRAGEGWGDVAAAGALWVPRGREEELRRGLWSEEVFGPLFSVYTVRSAEEALAIANDNAFGLTSCVYTNEEEEARRWARGARAGVVMVNRCDYVDPAGVWCGWGMSGRGEAGGEAAYRNVTRAKGLHARWW